MFVGDVRWATTGAGSSWKLSGGSPWSSGPTNVSKNSQVRRAVRRSDSMSASESSSDADSVADRLTHRATTGESSHSRMNGVAIEPALGFNVTTRTAVAAAATMPPIICR